MRNALLLYPSIVNNTISHGRAAEILGISKMELIELYGRLGIPCLDMTGEEFEEEVQTVKRIEGIVMIVVSDAIPIIALLKGTA